MRRTEAVEGRTWPGDAGIVCMRLERCEDTERLREGYSTAADATHTLVRSSGCVHAAATVKGRSAGRWWSLYER